MPLPGDVHSPSCQVNGWSHCNVCANVVANVRICIRGEHMLVYDGARCASFDMDDVWYTVVSNLYDYPVLHRIFPFDRGLFEDKVANFWCIADFLIKLRRFVTPTLQMRLW